MRYPTLKPFALMVLLFMLAAGSVHAQSRIPIEANIPFDWAVGYARLKAGRFIVDCADMEKLVVTNVPDNTRVFALFSGILEPMRNDPSSRLVFHRYGNLYFMSEAWISGNGNGFYPSKAERRLAKEFAKTNRNPETAKILCCPATGVYQLVFLNEAATSLNQDDQSRKGLRRQRHRFAIAQPSSLARIQTTGAKLIAIKRLSTH